MKNADKPKPAMNPRVNIAVINYAPAQQIGYDQKFMLPLIESLLRPPHSTATEQTSIRGEDWTK